MDCFIVAVLIYLPPAPNLFSLIGVLLGLYSAFESDLMSFLSFGNSYLLFLQILLFQSANYVYVKCFYF